MVHPSHFVIFQDSPVVRICDCQRRYEVHATKGLEPAAVVVVRETVALHANGPIHVPSNIVRVTAWPEILQQCREQYLPTKTRLVNGGLVRKQAICLGLAS
eukprot:COSAG05_NODE_1441_length_4880_cov_3.567245_4_plen_101_part_00